MAQFISPVLLALVFGTTLAPHCLSLETTKYQFGTDYVAPSIWNRMFYTAVAEAKGQLLRCGHYCVQSTTCNIFIIHQGDCYLGDVAGNHSLIQEDVGTGSGAVTLFSNLEGIILTKNRLSAAPTYSCDHIILSGSANSTYND